MLTSWPLWQDSLFVQQLPKGQGPKPPESHTAVPLWDLTLVRTSRHRVFFMTEKAKMTDLGCVGVAIGAADHSRLRHGAGLTLDQIRRSNPVLVGHVPLLLPEGEKRG